MSLPGARFRPVYFVPTFSKYQGELCAGVHICVIDRDAFQPVSAALHLLQTLKRRYPREFAWRRPWRDRARVRRSTCSGEATACASRIDADEPVETLIESWQPELRGFERLRAEYLLYR